MIRQAEATQRTQHLQQARAGGADEGADGHVDVGRPSLAAVEARPVGLEGALFPKDPKIPLLLLPPACGHV